MPPHHPGHQDTGADGGPAPLRILALDVGAGTQDILVYDSTRTPENCFKLVLPSQTQIVGRRIRAATGAGRPVHLTGSLMGGGESTAAARDHVAAGLPLTATSAAARTLHNDPARVAAMGVVLRDDPLPGAVTVETRDVDINSLRAALAAFEVELPAVVAVAVQDHGDPLAIQDEVGPPHPASNRSSGPPSNATTAAGDSVHNLVRFAYLQALLKGGGDLAGTVYGPGREPPPGMTRMASVRETVPGAYVMDTGAAAVLGPLGDPVVARAAQEGAILVNVGNMHTFAVLVRGRRLYGLFEHHTGGINAPIIADLVERLCAGTIDGTTFRRDFDGHGAALDQDYRRVGPFRFVAVTGPNRGLARSLGYHEAAPHGDMMLAGAYGLVEGVLLALAAAGRDTGVTLAGQL